MWSRAFCTAIRGLLVHYELHVAESSLKAYTVDSLSTMPLALTRTALKVSGCLYMYICRYFGTFKLFLVLSVFEGDSTLHVYTCSRVLTKERHIHVHLHVYCVPLCCRHLSSPWSTTLTGSMTSPSAWTDATVSRGNCVTCTPPSIDRV